MFPLVCELLFHLCILGTYFWDHFEIMLSCLTPKQKHTYWITQCAFHLEMQEWTLATILKQFCMIVGACGLQDCTHSSSCHGQQQGHISEEHGWGFAPSSWASFFLHYREEGHFSEDTHQEVIELRIFWQFFFFFCSSTGITSHIVAGNWPAEFF